MSHSPPHLTVTSLPTVGVSLPKHTYNALMLRCWWEGEEGGWRFWVQDVATGEQCGFADMDLLLAFLQQQFS